MQKEKAHVHKLPMRELITSEGWDTYAVFKQLRENTPVRYDMNRKVWDILGYDDCVRVLKDPYIFRPS
ncbi:MAG: hypothetical protein WCC10_00075 [Tumebacillaceae bacterium]